MRNRGRDLMAGFLFVLVFAVGISIAHAQIVSGSIVGTTTDPSGAVVPGAKVSIVNVNTELTRSVSTGSTGNYVFADLPPGTYNITANASGFRKQVITRVVLEVGATVREDFHLEVGQTTQEVTVQGAALHVESQTSSVGQVINAQRVENLPLNGRNFMQLAQLGSGTAPAYQARSATITNQSGRGDLAIHISGGRGDANSYLIDGVEMRNMWFNSPSILLSPDSIQEFKIQKNGYDARYGQGSGIISLVTKSGTNIVHGSVYEFIRNDKLDAANYFDNFFNKEKPPYRQNQFGFSLGGPVLKNKLFLFGNYEGFRVRQGNTLNALVPTPAQLSGDLTGLSSNKTDPTTGQPAILNPFTGQAFQGNQIPSQYLSQIVQKFKQYIPAPNADLPGVNLVVSPSTVRNDNQWTVRGDFHLSDKDTMFGRSTYYKSDLLRPGIAPLFGQIFPYQGLNEEFQETHLFSPTLLNVFKLGFNRSHVFHKREPTSSSVVGDLGIQNLTQVPASYGLPSFGITGYSGLGATIVNQGGTENMFQFTDEVNWSLGKHNIHFGADIRRIQFQQRLGLRDNGQFSFDGRYTGNAVADFLLGAASSASAQQGLAISNYRSTSQNYFFEDDYKLTSRLTLNLGLRYEYDTPFYEIDGKEGFFNTNANLIVARIPPGYAPITLPASKVVLEPSYQKGIWTPDPNNWAPRLGIAYSMTNNTVIRTAYGIFYSKTQGNELQGKANFPPLVITNSLSGSLTTPDVLIDQDAFPPATSINVGTLSPFSVDPHDRTPYIQQWNFDVQHSFGKNALAEIAYVGSKGSHLAERIEINQAPLPADPSNPTPLADRRPYQGWGNILSFNYGESSNYNGLQARFQKSFSHGLSFLASYTWSHSLDTASRGSGGSWHQNIYNRVADYGNSDFDVRHRFIISYTYDLPIGHGRHFLSSAPGVLDQFVGGWSLDGIDTFMTGNYQNVTVSGDRANTGGFAFQRANEVAGCSNNGNLPRGQRTIFEYFNTDCFHVTPFGTYGNSSRNIVESPGILNFDLAVHKNFRITERVRLQFRSEFFNAWNHAQFGVPQMNVQNRLFGQIRSAMAPREIQFALKLLW